MARFVTFTRLFQTYVSVTAIYNFVTGLLTALTDSIDATVTDSDGVNIETTQ